MGTIMLAGAIVISAFLGQGKQGVVSSADLDGPGASSPHQKAAPAGAKTKEKRARQDDTAAKPDSPEPAAPPSQHEPPAAAPNSATTPAPSEPQPAAPPPTAINAGPKKGRGVSAFWMTAPVE